MRNTRSLMLALGTALAVTACGGGGGSSNAPTPTPGGSPIQTTPITISSSNQTAVSQAAVAEAANIGVTASEAGSVLVGAAVDNGAVASRNYSLARDAMAAMQKALAFKPTASAIGAIPTETYACQGGGSGTISFTDANNNGGIDVGDTITFSYNNCVEGSLTLSGGFAVTMHSASGNFDNGTGAASGSFAYNNYVVASSGTAVRTHGSMTMAGAQTSTTSFSANLTLSSLRTTVTSGGTTVLDSQQTGSISITSSTVTYSASVIIDVSIAGSWTGGLGGQMTVKTEAGKPLVVDSSGNLVAGGVLLVSGNNSRLRITILSNTSAQVELDAANDGTYESTTTVAI